MGFNSVFRVLQELFPQVDSRFLKAVSLEHPKDVDAAAEAVVEMMSEKPLTVGSTSHSQSLLGVFDDGEKSGKIESTVDRVVVNPCIAEQSSEDHASSVNGCLLGATKALDAGNSEPKINCDDAHAPLLLETFEEANNINPDNETVSLDNHDQENVNIGGENVDNETSIGSESNRLVDISETNLADNFVNSEDESVMSSVLTRSEQICSTGYLDEVIDDAKNNKKVLALAMNSVVEFMKVVESKEQAAKQANEDVTLGCSDILAKVDEVKYALLRAKEANDMHAGEVNAEKAILATELRELQLRLFTLSDERNKALGILDEMRRALEIRMAAALEELAAAEDEKLERERSAREALLYQESEMEKVVEESKKLKLEAEENSKLQEFLIDRGHAIDILQGEIAVKCQDVLLLKEKFDKRIPLSELLFSSQTSSILASSSSSFKGNTTPFEPEIETCETPKRSSKHCDSYGIFYKSSRSDASLESPIIGNSINGEEKKVDELIGILDDDGWELYENGDFLVR